MPISERIYASLVTGHARAGDIDAASGVLDSMKKNGLTPHNIAYTSLLCAHAEMGNLPAIEAVSDYLLFPALRYVSVQVFGQMSTERLFPSMMTYLQVMNTLSRHGHGAMVADILNLVRNREWLSLGEAEVMRLT